MILSAAQREAVIVLARAAATEILAVYDSAFAIEHKDDRSPLTAADLTSHQCIVAGLQALTPDIPVLSEESKDIDIAARRDNGGGQGGPEGLRRELRRKGLVAPRPVAGQAAG